MKNSDIENFQVELPCPQCNAPVVLEETDRILSCEYCRVKLIILPDEYFRYYIAPNDPQPEPVYYVPYWRLRGLYFLVRSLEIENKLANTTVLACNLKYFPFSLGVQPQAIKLKLVYPEMEGTLLSPQIAFSNVINRFDQIFARAREPHADDKETDSIFLREFIGETVSLIYFPIFIRNNIIFDGILNSPLSTHTEDIPDFTKFTRASPYWKWTTKSLMCPHCGWDLDSKRDSIFFLCKNCSRAFLIYKSKFLECDYGITDYKDANAIYMPFWKVEVIVNKLIEESYEHQVKRTFQIDPDMSEENAPQTIFWIPAFKLIPQQFIRAARNLSSRIPKINFKKEIKDKHLFPVTLPVTEAVESVRVIIGEMAKFRQKAFPYLSILKVQLKKAMIVYLPFLKQGIDLVQPDMQFSVQYNAIRDRTSIEDLIG